ncbi:MAG TPA: PH domain-containing protein [Acidimicrobiales bacterium]|nr:PH domain-containing protein [Acidimicrobiales bacterium]
MPPDSEPAARNAMPAGAEGPAADGPDKTFRLHPLTPIALGGRILGLLVFLLLLGLVDHTSSGGSGGRWIQTVIFGGLAVALVIRGVITVKVTSYHLSGGELRIDSGLLQKQSKRIRLNRVQSVDVLEPFSARIFGLAEVKVTTAGSERAAIRLRYVAAPVAQQLRADLLARSAGGGHDGTADAVETPERLLLHVPHGQLVGAVLLQMVSWRLLLLAIGPVLAIVGNQNGHKATAGVGVALFISVGITFVLAVWKQLNTFWDFTVADSVDGLRVRHGLFSTARQTVPPGRIQAVLIHQPLSWRPFGWTQVRMNVAGYGRSDASRRTMLIPVADREYAERFVGWLLGGVDLHEIPLTRPPRRAAVRAPLWWRFELAGANDRLFVVRHGMLSRTVDVVPHERTQSLRITAGPFERALRLASVHLDSTRGPVKTRVAHRDAADAREILDRQVERARLAREASAS